MEPFTAVALVVCIFIALLMLNMSVGLALAASGTLGVLLLRNAGVAGATLGGLPFTSTSSYVLLVVPMFIFMGNLALHADIPRQIFDGAARVLRGVPGGLGLATIVACGGFAAVTGSSVATAATVGRISIGEMVQHGYSGRLAAGIVAAGGTLGVLIPPSIVLVLYGVVTGQSIGRLLIAGIVPGVLSAVLYMILIVVLARRQGIGVDEPAVAMPSAGDDTGAVRVASPRRLEGRHYAGIAKMFVLFLVVVGGIYAGVLTATESGAVGAFAAFLFLLAYAVRRGNAWPRIKECLVATASLTSMVFLIVVGSSIFSYFLVLARVPAAVTSWATELPVPPLLVVVVLLLLLIPLGMFLDSISVLLIAVPLMFPVIDALGFNGIWFGILIVKMIELGLVTPPVGMNLFVTAGATKGISVEDVFRGTAPFVLIDIVTIVILFLFPVITLWLPGRVG